MYTIQLHRLQFDSCHGLYEEERSTPQPFEVDVDVAADLPPTVTLIEHTVDYAGIYKVIERRMGKPSLLIEHLAAEMADAIKAYDYRITSINICIRKLKPPIPNFKGYAAISFRKSY